MRDDMEYKITTTKMTSLHCGPISQAGINND